ncbi:glycoside hydrolase family 15 protein [Symbiobacterium terraclitae]|uniref:glycoside hydrolase family 15 protein n=1 Tax=Symbiobacterium terraclitae TaxID=557451 RepID=UPI0035B54546
MARPLVIGNGRLLVCYDDRLTMRDLYYPHVGQVNHIVGRRNRVGIWVDGTLAWVGDDCWETQMRYRNSSMVAETHAVNVRLGLELWIRTAVHPLEDILIQHLRLRNRRDEPRQARVFITHDLDLEGHNIGDTAMWDPTHGVMIHYKRNCWVLIGAQGPEGGISQYATGRKRFHGAEGTWRDAEDGVLEGGSITQGSVDSTVGLEAALEPGDTADLYTWLVCGKDRTGVLRGHGLVLETGPEELLSQTERYWWSWARSGRGDLGVLPEELREAYYRSLLIIRTQADDSGALIAASDSDILESNRDHYGYMWPRDGAFIAAALDRAGHRGFARRFYRFCRAALSEEGFFWHKYNPDGSVGSSWHPWVGSKGVQLPIQEDETALVLWALGNHCLLNRDQEFAGQVFADLTRPAADFLVRYRDPETGLPEESYDLWEERRGVFTFTTAAVIAGLKAAAGMARMLGDYRRAQEYTDAAEQTQGAMLKHLWSDEQMCFLRGVYRTPDGRLVPDPTLDSSVMGVFLLGVLPAWDPRVTTTAQKLEAGLWANTKVGGMARYYDDYYFRVCADPAVAPGNPWIICTLWLAKWHIARARTKRDLQPGLELIRWTLRHAMPTGGLPEQVDPFTGRPLSVAPLTWSHATLIDVLLDLAEKLHALPD